MAVEVGDLIGAAFLDGDVIAGGGVEIDGGEGRERGGQAVLTLRSLATDAR